MIRLQRWDSAQYALKVILTSNGKSGFTYADEFGIRYHGLSKGEDASFFLCTELTPGYLDGITGEYETPAGYFVDEAEADEFDKGFP